MKKSYLLFFAVLVCTAFMAAGLSSAWAQESQSDAFELEEITVTAQKRAENQQKVPIQMEVIAGDELLGTGKDNVDDILRDISNVLVNKSPDGMRVTVRGLADENSPWHDMHVSTPTVAVNIDGAYNSSSAAGQNLFDLERVEVLAGPQSTLYGSNSPGGIVNVVTASPKTDKFSVSASSEVGNFGLLDGQAMVNVPVLQDLLAFRLAAQKYKRDSWVEGSDNSQDTTTVRLKTLYQPTENFSANVTLNWSESANGGRLGGEVLLFDTEDGNWMTVNQDGSITKGDKVTNPWTASSSGGGGGGGASADAETKGIQAEIAWDSALGALTVVPNYSKQESSDYDGAVWSGQTSSYTRQYRENSTEQKGAELRMTSPEDFFFKWIVGGTYYESDRINITDDYDNDGNDQLQNTTQENKAVYGNLTYPITDTFRGTAGYRRSWDDVGNVETPAKVGDGVSGQEYSNPDYKVGVEYDIADNSMLYANYATSYRVNAMAVSQTAGGVDKTVPPEELKSYTVGTKNRFFSNRLQLNVSAFYYDYQNKNFEGSEDGRLGGGGPPPDPNAPPTPATPINEWDSEYWHTDPTTGEEVQGTDFNNDGDLKDTTVTDDPGNLYTGDSEQDQLGDISDPWIQQFGDFESYGVDISADVMITGRDRLNLSVSYMHTEWTDAVVSYYWPWLWETEGKSYNGESNTFSPTWSANASYRHNFTLGSFGTLVPQIDVQYQSKYKLSFSTELDGINWQEEHYILNSSLSFTHSSNMWSVNAYVKNATDYAVKTFWMNQAGSYSLGLGDPRTYGAVLSVKF
jgi:iron complex outermembrane receptor protein